MKVFAENLRRRAVELGLSNAEVARRAGLAERRYGNYIIGRREPDLATLLRIAEVVGSSVDELLRPRLDTAEISLVDGLRGRLVSAALVLNDRDLNSVVVQVEALAAQATEARTADKQKA